MAHQLEIAPLSKFYATIDLRVTQKKRDTALSLVQNPSGGTGALLGVHFNDMLVLKTGF